MAREQEIKKRLFEISTSNFNNSVVDSSAYFAGYMAGAKWADAHPDIDVRTMAAWQSGYKEAIEKACEWLSAELDKEEERHYIHVHGFDKEHREIFLEDFRKAMKGGEKLDADKVIEWLKPYSVIEDNIINEFKKDFGL